MEQINKIIFLLLALANFSKDIHYTCNSIEIHKFMDDIYDGLYDFIDEIKEKCILAGEELPLPSAEYMIKATSYIPPVDKDTNKNLIQLKMLIISNLNELELIPDLSSGETSLFDNISDNLQGKLGLLNIQLRDK